MTNFDLFDYAKGMMKIRGINSFYKGTKSPIDVVDAGCRKLGSSKATQMRSQAFNNKAEILGQLNSPTYCSDVDAYVPFWWAVRNYPESMFEDWDKRISMGASLQKQQYVFQTLAQLFLNGASSVDDGDPRLLPADHYMPLEEE